MPRRKAIKLTKKQLWDLLDMLVKQYPKLLKKIGFRTGSSEWICGSISNQITKFLRTVVGIDARNYSGLYKGRGTEFSGGKTGTPHCWVEIYVKVTNHLRYGEKNKPFRVIIDGAYAQFFPDIFTPNPLKNRMRLTIFVKDPIAEKWYKGRELDGQFPLNKHPKIKRR